MPDFPPAQAARLRAARAALNPLHERRREQKELEHLYAYPNAIPGQPENIFETLTDPDLFPPAQAALQAEDGQATTDPEPYLN
jgi:hypothetical protein